MKRRVAWLAVLLVAVAACGWWFRPGIPDAGIPPAAPAEAAAPAVAVTEHEGLTVVGGTGFDQFYRSPEGSVRDDLRHVSGLLDAAALLVKDLERFPLPDNADFTAFLGGKNPHRVAWIRPGHPAVSPAGELLDRWETPLFFHRESARRTTLRSAGPDRTMWTEDDIEWPEPPPSR